MTNLIVISSEVDVENEVSIVNELFYEGLELFHLRKPEWPVEMQRDFLKKVNPDFLNNISVHQNYQTVSEFDLKYCHVKEKDRRAYSQEDSLNAAVGKIKKSTSFHDYNELQFQSHLWDYCFLSPVFDSLSKPGYKSSFKKDFQIEADLYQRVFALGGVTQNNIEEIFKKEFYGAAVLGEVWQDPINAVKNFKELKEKCRQNVHTH